MTPLAQLFANDLCQPVSRRQFEDYGRLGPSLSSLHFFEISAVLPLATDLAQQFAGKGIPGNMAFLPADAVWIEYREPSDNARYAMVLKSRGAEADLFIVMSHPGRPPRTSHRVATIPLTSDSRFIEGWNVPPDFGQQPAVEHEIAKKVFLTYAALAIINTPRIIGRRQHMPHAGLQRKLAAARGMVGKFPLRAWTEIILEVTPPVIDDGEPHEARLTGGKALHFCRSHLRVRRGQLELVKAHWRGDPALGIKRSRYSVVPPKHAA